MKKKMKQFLVSLTVLAMLLITPYVPVMAAEASVGTDAEMGLVPETQENLTSPEETTGGENGETEEATEEVTEETTEAVTEMPEEPVYLEQGMGKPVVISEDSELALLAADDSYVKLTGICYNVRNNGVDVGVAYESNSDSVLFRWEVYNLDTKEWSVIADWNGGNWATWTPTAGNYWLQAQAKTANGEIENYTICFYADRDYTDNYFTLNGICYIDQENSIDVGVSYDAGTSLQFRWLAYNLDTQSWETISDWYDGNWATWTPKAGNYWLQVQARTADGAEKAYTICFAATKNYSSDYVNLNGICMIQNYDTVDVGVSYDSSDPDVTFMWQIYDVNAETWTTIADWTKSNWVTWNVTSGSYWINVTAKTSKGTTENYCQGVSLQDKSNIEIKGITMHRNSKTADLSVDYSSGDTNISFMWQIYDVNARTWTTISDWSTSPKATWNVTGGTYWINVTARNGAGRTVSHCEGVELKEIVSQISNVAYDQNAIEADVTLTGYGTGFHAKLVMATATSAVSFGIQYDAYAVAPYTGKTMALIENVKSNDPGQQEYIRPANRDLQLGQTYHLMLVVNQDGSGNVYIDNECIGSFYNPNLAAKDLSLRIEGSGRKDGDQLTATFQNVRLKKGMSNYVERAWNTQNYQTNPTMNIIRNEWDDITFTGYISGLGATGDWDNRYNDVSFVVAYY
ncbi:MAG: hypothetical protein MRZ93_11735 [Lachnospiraceae bacterium]|nr:hypothetical protein [Lachnospiraceae bacterium]